MFYQDELVQGTAQETMARTCSRIRWPEAAGLGARSVLVHWPSCWRPYAPLAEAGGELQCFIRGDHADLRAVRRQMAVHPDDPPAKSLFGLPRIVKDLAAPCRRIESFRSSPYNGFTLSPGSLGRTAVTT